MPVLESTDKLAPRSVLRHRPIGTGEAQKGQPSNTTAATIPMVQRASRVKPPQADVSAEVTEWQRADTKPEAAKGQATAPTRKTTTAPPTKSLPKLPRLKINGTRQRTRKFLGGAHPLLYLGMGMLVMLTLWTMLSVTINWVHTTMDDIRYGRPRTFQTDQFVGHSESAGIPSHFIAINLNRRIEVIEFPGGDASHARIYMGPQLYGLSDDLTPVTLRFVDVNGDHKVDMIVQFQSTQIVYINDQGGFRPILPNERPRVEQFLQHLGP